MPQFNFLDENSYGATPSEGANNPLVTEVDKKKKPTSFGFLDDTSYDSTVPSPAVNQAVDSVVRYEDTKPRGFVENYLALSDRLGQLGAEMDVGIVKSVGSLASGIYRSTNTLSKAIDKSFGVVRDQNQYDPNYGDTLTNLGNEMDKHIGVQEKKYLDHVFEGIGSSIPYLVGGVAGKTIGLSTNLMALGLGGTEALVNAYDDYDTLKKEDPNNGNNKLKALASFGGNLAVNFITDRLGFLGEGSTKSVRDALKKFAISTLMESGQETAQQAISNLATGKNPTQGLADTFLVSLPISVPFGAVGLVESGVEGKNNKRTEKLLQELANSGVTKEEAAGTLSSITGVDNPTAMANVNYFTEQNPELNTTYEANAQKKIDDALAEVSASFEPMMEHLKQTTTPAEEAAFQTKPAEEKSTVRTGGEIGKEYNSENMLARERFDIPNLEKVSFGGSDRDVYSVSDNAVVKIAKSSRGLDQNASSVDYYAEDQGLIPKTIEVGKNYLVKEKVFPPDAQTKSMVKDIRNMLPYTETDKDFYVKLNELEEKYGMDGKDIYNFSEIGNYRILINDFKAIRNWGTTAEGKPILLDEGTLNGDLVKNKQTPENIAEYNDMKREARRMKKEFGDTDQKTAYKKAEETKTVSAQVGIEKIKSYQERLGVQFPVFIYNKIYTGQVENGAPEQAFGMYLDNTITLAEAITQFTADHEVGHFAFRNLDKIPVFEGMTQSELYSELKKKYGDLSKIQLEEKLMEGFEKFAAEQEAKKPTTFTGKIKQFFTKLYSMISDIFNVSPEEASSINKFYDTLYFGKGKGITTFENSGKTSDFMEARFKEFGEETPAFQKVDNEFVPERSSQNAVESAYQDILVEEEIPVIAGMPEKLTMTGIELEMMKASLDQNPLKELKKYEATSGEFKGQLPEVIGQKSRGEKGYRKVSEFARRGDDIVQELFGAGETYALAPDVEQVRQAYDDYKRTIAHYREYLADYKKSVAQYKLEQRDAKAIEKLLNDQAKKTEQIRKEIDRHNAFVDKIFGKGFRAGEKAGMVIGRKQATNKFTNTISDIQRKNELEKLKDNIIKRSYTRTVLDALRTNIPRTEWATYMTRLTQVGTSETKFKNVLEAIYERKAELDIENKSRIDTARIRSTIAYLKKIYDIEPTLIRSIKEDLGIDKSIKELSLIELEQFKNELNKRIQFRKDNPVKYLENTSLKEKKGVSQKLKKIDQNLIAPLERKVKQISKPLYESVMTVFFQTEGSNQTDVENTKAMVDTFNKATEDDQILITKYAQSADETRLKTVLEKYATPEEVDAMLASSRETLDRIYKDLKSVDVEVPYRGFFFPRRLKPLNVEQANLMLSTFEYKMGRKATEEERLAIINNLLRGFNPSQLPFITLSGKRFEAHRLIEELPIELMDMYEDFATALQSYISGANAVIEQRKFFGKSVIDTMNYDANLENSIGNKVLELHKAGIISSQQMDEVRDTLQTLFAYRLSEGARAVQQFTNDYIYPLTLGQITSTISQAKDLTMQTLLDIFEGQFNLFGKQMLNANDINLSEPIQQLESSVKTSENKVAQFGKKIMTPFSKADSFFLDVFINSSYKRMVKLAKAKNNTRFKSGLVDIFGEEGALKLIEELQSKTGNETGDQLPEGAKRWLFSEVAKVRPITKLQKARGAIRNPAWYTLKNFAVKQLEFVRSQSIDLMVEGKRTGDKKLIAEGAGKFVAILAYMAFLGAGIDELKDWIMGRNKDTFWDKIVDNTLQVFGLSNYILQTGQRDGFAKQTALSLSPAALSITYQIIDDAIADVKNTIDGDPIYDAKNLKRIPLVGNIFYNRFGGGSN